MCSPNSESKHLKTKAPVAAAQEVAGQVAKAQTDARNEQLDWLSWLIFGLSVPLLGITLVCVTAFLFFFPPYYLVAVVPVALAGLLFDYLRNRKSMTGWGAVMLAAASTPVLQVVMAIVLDLARGRSLCWGSLEVGLSMGLVNGMAIFILAFIRMSRAAKRHECAKRAHEEVLAKHSESPQ